MAGIGNPGPEAVIQGGIDRDRVRAFRPASHRRDDTVCDPIMNDPEANAISFSHLSHAEAPGRRFGRRNAMLVSDPFDRADREWLPCRTAMAFSAQQGDNVTIRM